jgi:hypothetical protein
MGLFDQLSSTNLATKRELNPAESFAGILLVAVVADGYLATEEISSLMDTFNRTQIFRSYSRDVVARMLDNLLKMMNRLGFKDFLNLAISSLPYQYSESTFAIVADLILADGEVTQEEEAVLMAIGKGLSLSESTMKKIVDVMIIKNKI